MVLRSRPIRKRLRILAILGDQTGCEIYRVKIPFTALRRNGYDAHWIDQSKMAYLSGEDYDIIILPRMIPSEKDVLQVIQLAQDNGVKFIFESDDDLTNTYREVVEAEAYELMMSLLHQCDAVTVSTPYLNKLYGEGKPSFVLPNHVNLADWSPFLDTRKDDSLTIGITGSQTHDKDWEQLIEPLHCIADKYKDVHFFFGGYVPEYFRDLPRVTYYDGFLSYDKYPGAIRQIDIGLAAVNNDPFNLGKSGIKAVEYMASVRKVGKSFGGAVPVVSNHPIYRRVVNNRHNGILVSDNNWYSVLAEVIEDKKFRERLSLNGYKWVRKNRSTDVCVHQWAQTYIQVYRL